MRLFLRARAEINFVIRAATTLENNRWRRKAGQLVKILSRFNQGISSSLQAFMPSLMPFDANVRHLASHESVGGRLDDKGVIKPFVFTSKQGH